MPCCDCISNPVVEFSKKPLFFEENPKIKDKYGYGYPRYVNDEMEEQYDMKTFREIKSKYCDADIEVEHYEDVNFKPMSAVFVDGEVLYYEEDTYGTTPMDKEPVKCEIEPVDDRFAREAYEGNYGTI